jgi:DNA-directed RNA polymerase specialized sigma24 family protein
MNRVAEVKMLSTAKRRVPSVRNAVRSIDVSCEKRSVSGSVTKQRVKKSKRRKTARRPKSVVVKPASAPRAQDLPAPKGDAQSLGLGKAAATKSVRNSLEFARKDKALVDRCLGGDSAAWAALYDQFHEAMLRAIRALLGRNATRHDVVDEIAARVWFAVIDHDGRLLRRFDGERGYRLSTFLSGLAKNEISRHYRTERRRNVRETQVCLSQSGSTSDAHVNSVTGLTTAVSDFLATLTPRERQYCLEVLLANGEQIDDVYSDANRWQLNHRVRSKLSLFLNNA